MVRFTSIFALLLLTGCPDETVVITPVPDPGLQLIDGSYELRIIDITSIECDGVRGSDLIGQSLYASLETVGTGATLSVEGIELKGGHSGGILSVDGSVSYDYEVGCYEVEDSDGDDTSTSNDSDDEPDSGDSSSGSGGSSTGSKGGGGSTGCVEPDEPETVTYSMALDAQVHSTRSAIGDLSIAMEGCSAEVVVSMSWGPQAQPVPMVEEETEPVEEGEEVEVPCDDDEADCG